MRDIGVGGVDLKRRENAPVILRRVARAILRRCPDCGEPGVFTSWMRLVDTCPACGLRYEREEGYWLGAILINTAATIGLFGVLMIGWALATWPDPPWGTMTAVGIGMNLVLPILLYPWSKTLWVAIEITAHPPAVVSRQSSVVSEEKSFNTAREIEQVPLAED